MSQRNSGYVREARDLYQTPAWVTHELLRVFPIPDVVWEPACGYGKIVKELPCRVFSSDIQPGIQHGKEINFLSTLCVPFRVHGSIAIITNPPFDQAYEFCKHAIKLMEPHKGSVAMLLRCDFDHAKTRTDIFRDCPAFSKKLTLLRRIIWFERKGAAPSYNHAWFIWDWNHNGPPQIVY